MPMYAYPAYEAGIRLKDIDASNSLILVVPYRNDMSPEILYYANRKGWVERADNLTVEMIEEYKDKGVEYLVTTHSCYPDNQVREYLSKKESYPGWGYLIVKL